MKSAPDPKSYRLSFILNTAVGGVMLLLSTVGNVCEAWHPSLGSSLSWSFLLTAVICLFIASLHYTKFLSLSR